MPHHRRKSVDSSSSSSDSEDSHGKKLSKQEKKERKERKKATKSGHKAGPDAYGAASGHSQAPLMPIAPVDFRSMPQEPQHNTGSSQPPISGFRIPLTTSAPFPNHQQVGPAPCNDLNGSPVYFGSALFQNSVHPCKIAPHINPPCLVPYAGIEQGHQGRYDLLPFDSNTMELVLTSHGQIPTGRRPVEGGYEDHGAKLYHAIGVVDGVRVPGKTGAHLGGCNVAFGGREHGIANYEILCWK